MTEKININRFFSTIFAALTAVCLLFVVLLWSGLNHLEAQQSELLMRQKTVNLMKDTRFHIAEIQQYLTDVGATHQQDGLQHAETHWQAALVNLQVLSQLYPTDAPQCEFLSKRVTHTYQNGINMAWAYLRNGMEGGNPAMETFDKDSNQLKKDLDTLAFDLDNGLDNITNNTAYTFKQTRVILLSSAPIVLVFMMLFMLKISRLLKQKMDDLADRTHQLNTILNTIPSGVITINPSGHVVSFNHAAERMFGYSGTEIIQQNIKLLMPDAIADLHDGYLQKYAQTGQSHILGQRRELEGKHKDGRLFPILLRVNPMEVHGEQFFSGVIDDISETRHLQEQLGQSQKLEAIGQLASGVAHEINTPIQYIGDNLSSLQENLKDIIAFQQQLMTLGDEKLQAEIAELVDQFDLAYILEDSPTAIQQSQEGVEKVAEIVKAMKMFSHLESGAETTALDLRVALQSALTITRNTYKYIAEVETDYASDISSVEAYASELNQVFLNLIINASHAIEEKQQGQGQGLIRIVTRKLTDEYVEILIADNGMGIPAEIQEKVFNLFFTTKPVGKGTGQGLSLAHNIVVEKHHGKLFFESKVGKGTTFHIQLPIKLSAAS